MIKGSFENMQKQNQKNILTLIKNEKAISRAKIAEKLDVSRATITNNVKELIELDLIIESKMGKSSGGRRPMLLKLNPDGAYVIGFEWGIDSLKSVLINFESKIIQKDEIEMINHNLEEYENLSFKIIKKYIDSIKNNKKIIGIGLGIHGLVNPETGKSIFTPHFEWGEVNIKDILEEKFDYPIFIDNDVRMMAAAEIWQGRDDFILINTGSGIGAALVFKSELHYGNNFAAGEFGHIRITDQGPRCHCGKKGCLEALASKESIIKRYKKLKNLAEVDFKTIMINYEAEEKEALLVIDEALKYFARAIADIVNILNPEAVIIAGLFAEYSEHFIEPLLALVKREALTQAVENLKILTPANKEFVGAVGAAEKVLNNFFELKL